MMGVHSFKISKKTDQHIHSKSYGFGTWEGSLIIAGVLALMSQEGKH